MKTRYMSAQTGKWEYREATQEEKDALLKQTWDNAMSHIEIAKQYFKEWEQLYKE